LNPSFKKKLLLEGITKDDIKIINDANYLNLNKLAITNSDAVIMGSEKINSELKTFIEEWGMPVLEYKGEDEYIDKYSDFYDELIS
jgi:starch synthase